MRGEAKRDYPACIGYQSPWWKEYTTIEDHFARVNSALTRGRPVTRVAVIHPVESFWLCFGPKDNNAEEMAYRDQAFIDLTKWLLLGHIDFDFIAESLFPEQTALGDIKGPHLPVGKCSYDVVICPNLRTVRSTTLERLNRFAAQGGTVLLAGSTPTMVDAKTVTPPPKIEGKQVAWSKDAILNALQPFRDIDMIVSDTTLYRTQGTRANSLMYQLREDGDQRYLFICNVDRDEPCPVNMTIKGEYKVEVSRELEVTLTGRCWIPCLARIGRSNLFKARVAHG